MMKHNDTETERELPVEEPTAATAAAEPQLPAEETLPPVTDAEGAFTPDWFRRFEELQPYAATLTKFRRPEALAKSYAHLERLKGYPEQEDAVRMAAFRRTVGLPATAEEYSLARPEDTPDELWNPALAASLSRVAYEFGVPPRAMEALTARYAEEGKRHMQENMQREQQALADADALLQDEWGSRYEENMDTVSSFLKTMGERAGVDLPALLQNPALRANPDFVKLMLETASVTREAPLHEGEPQDERHEAHRIAHDPTHPLHEAYMRTSHPQHRYANEQYDRLAFGRR